MIDDINTRQKGSLHNANGGYLIIQAAEFFKNIFSWEALKRASINKEIRIEDATEQLRYFMLEDNGHNNKSNSYQWVSDIVMK